MTAALAEAPGVAWFVPVGVPGRSPVRPPASPAARPTATPAARPKARPGRRRLAVVMPPAPIGERVRPVGRPTSQPPAVQLRLTRRGAHVVALAVLTLMVVGGVGRLEAGPALGAAPVARVAPGTPLTSTSGLAVAPAGR